jgi:NADH-quinone oxidoreductase subunit J
MPSLELILAFLQPQVILFLLFGVGALATALTMLLHPNPVRAALFLVLNLFCVAVLYLLLNAYFWRRYKVVVYAGAIMVLFLFVIMLLNLGTPDRTQDRLRIQQPLAAVAGLILAGAVAVTLVRTMPLPGARRARQPATDEGS